MVCSIRHLTLVVAGLAATFALGSVRAAEAAGAATPPFDLLDASRIAVGKLRFASTCAAYCHGAEGVGGRAPSFKDNPYFESSAAFKTITEGRRSTDIMPPWGKTFTAEQIWELVAYLQFLSKQPLP